MADYCPYCGDELDTTGHGIYPDYLQMLEAITCPVIPEGQMFVVGGRVLVTRTVAREREGCDG